MSCAAKDASLREVLAILREMRREQRGAARMFDDPCTFERAEALDVAIDVLQGQVSDGGAA